VHFGWGPLGSPLMGSWVLKCVDPHGAPDSQGFQRVPLLWEPGPDGSLGFSRGPKPSTGSQSDTHQKMCVFLKKMSKLLTSLVCLVLSVSMVFPVSEFTTAPGGQSAANFRQGKVSQGVDTPRRRTTGGVEGQKNDTTRLMTPEGSADPLFMKTRLFFMKVNLSLSCSRNFKICNFKGRFSSNTPRENST
jgi:hypothetical protein